MKILHHNDWQRLWRITKYVTWIYHHESAGFVCTQLPWTLEDAA